MSTIQINENRTKRVACAPCQTAAVFWIPHVGQAADSTDATHAEVWHEVVQ